MQVFEFIVGAVIVVVTLFDVFQSVVLPRPTPATFRPSGGLIWVFWTLCRALAMRLPAERREQLLGTFAPFTVMLLLLWWVGALIVGYGLVMFALAAEIHPAPPDLGTAIYFAGVALTTVGFGDFVPAGGVARVVALIEAATGLGVVALVITFLYTLYGAFQRRETLVVTLSARAGAPPSGVTLLETYARYGMLEELPRVFADWEVWSAEVLDSHLSYPILAYFRSTHDNQSWISALGAVLDAATLLLTAVEEGPRGPAKLTHSVGVHLVADLAQYFGLGHNGDAYVERAEFAAAYQRLAAAGFRLREEAAAWPAFTRLRADYAGPLNAMARQWVTPPADWIGDRSYFRPHGKRLVAPGGVPVGKEGRRERETEG